MAAPDIVARFTGEVGRLVKAGRITEKQGVSAQWRLKTGTTTPQRAIFELQQLEKANGYEPSATLPGATPSAKPLSAPPQSMAIKKSPDLQEKAEAPPPPTSSLPAGSSGSISDLRKILTRQLPPGPSIADISMGGGRGVRDAAIRPLPRVPGMGEPPAPSSPINLNRGINLKGTGTLFNVSTQTENPMNLMDALGGAITGVTQYQLNKQAASQAAQFGAPIRTTPTGFTDSVFDYFTDATGNVVATQPCKKRRRRRRRALVTPSELAQLSALKNTLGASNTSGNEVFKTWVATRKI